MRKKTTHRTFTILTMLFCLNIVGTTMAASRQPVTTLTEQQVADNEKTYFNCDHGGRLGCLVEVCRAKTFSRKAAATVQFLYADVAKDFPELVTEKLSECFLKAGGRFQ